VELRRQLWEYVTELNRQGVTIVLTTHYLEEAEALCDTIAIVNHGQVVTCQPTQALLRTLDSRTMVITPAQPLTAAPALGRFTGKLNKDGRLTIDFKTAETDVETVLAAVREAGVGIQDLAIREPALEDVFLALTYGADETIA
jgi:ABC-2 type transport system ATP-binding protein